MSTTQETGFSLGMIGLGTMGRNLLLNMAEHGFTVAGYDKDASKVSLLGAEGKDYPVRGFDTLETFIQSLKSPKAVMLLVPAGKIVDSVIQDLKPLLTEGDIIIDAGNSHFTDTNRRVAELEAIGLNFFGMGVSGGEEGARKGPSMMPGGDKESYEFVKPILESIAAKVENTPCVTYIGPGAAGHFVKMVHNGIEYGLMQLIAETYELVSKGLQLPDEEIHQMFKKWNQGRLQSFLIEITSHIFTFRETGNNHLLLNDIRDQARSKGTGKWTSQVAMDLETPISTIDAAVEMRDLSKYKDLRILAASVYGETLPTLNVTNKEDFLTNLEQAFYFSMIISYAQGMHLLFNASKAYNYGLKMQEIAKIWRGGCIIRSGFLNDIYNAYQTNQNLEHLLVDEQIAALVTETLPATRSVIASAISNGLAVPAYAASLSYFDAFRSKKMPSNLIQAQRDYFGAHTYELIGKEGFIHSNWIVEALLPNEEVAKEQP
ncbi:MAG: gndA [Segetibacter sp.]|jgi:6-phosphogluconate dehydrogenase|nr:gndA [Segetibacter sp.]